MAIAGFALIFIAIGIILYNYYGITSQEALVQGQSEKVVNTLLAKADELASYDTGFTTYIMLDFPEGLEELKIGKENPLTKEKEPNKELSLKVKTSKGDLSEVAGSSLYANIEGYINPTSGLKNIGICYLGENICVVELQPGETCFDKYAEETTNDKPCKAQPRTPQFCGDGLLNDDERCDCIEGATTGYGDCSTKSIKPGKIQFSATLPKDPSNYECNYVKYNSCSVSEKVIPTQPTCLSPAVCKSSCSSTEQQTTDTCAVVTDKCCTPITVPTNLCGNNALDTSSGEQCDKVNNNILFNTNLGYDETRFTCDLTKCTANSKDWCICDKSNVYPFLDDINPNIVTPIDWRTTIECKEKYECLVIYNNKKEECKQYQCDDLIYSNADVNKDAKITVEDVNIVTQCIGKLFTYNWCTITKTPVNLQAPVPKLVIDGTLEKSCECSAADVFNMQPSENVIDIYDTKTMEACLSDPKQSWCTPILEKRADVNRNGRLTNVDDEIVNYCVGKPITTDWCSVQNLSKYDPQD